jgi:hypothetical protein
MAIGVIDTVKPISDFPVSEAPDIDVEGRRLNTVIKKIKDDIDAIDKNIQVISDEDLDNLT